MHCNRVILLAVALLPTAVLAQESYKIEALDQGPPAALAGPIKEALGARGYRVVDDQGKTYRSFRGGDETGHDEKLPSHTHPGPYDA